MVTTSNPWLSIPLDDYEGHMSSAEVQQLGALSDLFGEALALCRPASVAVLGLAGGNGLERIDRNVTRRIIGIDINPGYLEATHRRFAALDLQLHCLDLAEENLELEAVELAHAALLFEHTGTGRCLENAASLVAPGGALSVVLQIPGDTTPDVTPGPFPSIQLLAPHFSLVDPGKLRQQVAHHGLRLEHESRRTVPGGKVLWMGVFRRDTYNGTVGPAVAPVTGGRVDVPRTPQDVFQQAGPSPGASRAAPRTPATISWPGSMTAIARALNWPGCSIAGWTTLRFSPAPRRHSASASSRATTRIRPASPSRWRTLPPWLASCSHGEHGCHSCPEPNNRRSLVLGWHVRTVYVGRKRIDP